MNKLYFNLNKTITTSVYGIFITLKQKQWKKTVDKRLNIFSESRTTLEDNDGRGRKQKMRMSLTSSVAEALQADRRAAVRGLTFFIILDDNVMLADNNNTYYLFVDLFLLYNSI